MVSHQTLRTTLEMVKKQEQRKRRGTSAGNTVEFTRTDKLSLYLELSECLRLDGQVRAARIGGRKGAWIVIILLAFS